MFTSCWIVKGSILKDSTVAVQSVNRFWFQLLTCKDLLLFFEELVGQKNQFEGICQIFFVFDILIDCFNNPQIKI